MLSGQITPEMDWNQAFYALLDVPVQPRCILLVLSDNFSGSIGVRDGRVIVGANASDGSLGAAALRQLFSLQRAYYRYVLDEGVGNPEQVDQGLGIVIQDLINGPRRAQSVPPPASPMQQPQPAPMQQPVPQQITQPMQAVAPPPPPPPPPQSAPAAQAHSMQQSPPQPPPPPPPPPPQSAPAAQPHSMQRSAHQPPPPPPPPPQSVPAAQPHSMPQSQHQPPPAAPQVQWPQQPQSPTPQPAQPQAPPHPQSQPMQQWPQQPQHVPHSAPVATQPMPPAQPMQQWPQQTQQPASAPPTQVATQAPPPASQPMPQWPQESHQQQAIVGQPGQSTPVPMPPGPRQQMQSSLVPQPVQSLPQMTQAAQPQQMQQWPQQPPPAQQPFPPAPQPVAPPQQQLSPPPQQQPVSRGYGQFTPPEMPPPPPPRAAMQQQQQAAQGPINGAIDRVVSGAKNTYSKLTTLKAQARQKRNAAVSDEEVEDQSESRRLRAIEVESVPGISAKRPKRFGVDGATILGVFAIILALVAVGGGIFIATQMGGTDKYMSDGMRYLEQGRPDLAITQFTLVLDKTPQDLKALQARAEAYDAQQDLEHAAADYTSIAQIDATRLDMLQKAAYYQFKLGNHAQALELAEKGATADDKSDAFKALRAMSLARLGRHKEAIESGKALAADLVPSYMVSELYSALGVAGNELGSTKDAIKYYALALRADPNNETALSARAAAFVSVKDYSGAVADFTALTKLAPGKAEHYVNLAQAYENLKDFGAATRQLEEAVKLAPTAKLYMELAHDHFEAGKYGRAVADCEAALQLDPRCKPAVDFRVIALQKAKSEKAIVIATIVDDDEEQPKKKKAPPLPTTPPVVKDPLTDTGHQQMERGHIHEAVVTLAKATARTPGDVLAHRYYANALMMANRPREAFEQYSLLQKQKALQPSDELEFAKCAEAIGSFEQAIQLYFSVLNREENYVQVRISLIKLLTARGYKQKASQLVSDGIKLNPGSAEALRAAASTSAGK